MARVPYAADTSAEAEHALIQRYAAMSPMEKLRQVEDLCLSVRQLAAARIRRQYGSDLEEREMRLRLGALQIDRSLMVAAFGWDPEVEGY